MFKHDKGDSLMRRKTVLAATLMLAAFALAAARPSIAQGEAPKNSEADKTPGAYRLDYTMSELDDGKKINTRQYSMNLRSNDWNEIKIGTRVPVESKPGEFQYLDVGMNIRCHVVDQADRPQLGNNVALNVQADLSGFAVPEQGQSGRPTIRQIKIEGSTIMALNKPMVVGVVDDPNSKHQFQLEVVATKLK
jgi:hypothetical protein